MSDPVIHELSVDGYPVHHNEGLGLLSISHDGSITWEQLQYIKNMVWGEDARAIEVYPAQSKVVNTEQMRHLWRLSDRDFCPDLLGDDGDVDSLQARHATAWAEARG